MRDWRQTIVNSTATIKHVIETIDKSALGIALVVNEENRLIGTVTDGDVRRGILKGVSLDEKVTLIMNTHPVYAREFEDHQDIINKMKSAYLRHIPVIDENHRLVRLETLDEMIIPQKQDNWVVLMAGGLGSRLRPLTEDCPKPMLKVGGKPILETILGNLINFGYCKFFISVNYKAEMVEEYFKDGQKWGVEIQYIKENKRLGTAGALSLLPEKPNKTIIVMNGDLLTKVNFNHLLYFHEEQRSIATMCVREFNYQIPYGVVKVDKHKFVDIEEKPIQNYFVNAGIYALSPKTLDFIPKNQYFDMPSLFNVVSEKYGACVFPIREYWLDIGRLDDYEKANEEFYEVFE